jgi:hypothetical protein
MVNAFWFPVRMLSLARCLFAMHLLALALRAKGDASALRDCAVLLDFRRCTRVRDLVWNQRLFNAWVLTGRVIMQRLEMMS